MLFTSIEFFIFLPLVLIGYYAINQKYRWIFLLGASYVFYAGWKLSYLGLIFFSTVVDFLISNLIYKTEEPKKRKRLLIISLFSNFFLLIVFKYFHFLIGGSAWFHEVSDHHPSMMWLQFVYQPLQQLFPLLLHHLLLLMVAAYLLAN